MGLRSWLTERLARVGVSRTAVGQPLSGGVQTYTGIQAETGEAITPLEAMRCSTVNACVQAIATELSKLPWSIIAYTDDGGREALREHPVARLLSDEANPSMGSMTWRELVLTSAVLTGNGYSLIERDAVGNPVALHFLRADEVLVYRLPDTLEVVYKWNGAMDGTATIHSHDMFHLMWNSPDGLLGYSPISLAKQSIALALAAERFGAAYYKNAARPSGVLSTDRELSAEAIQRMRESWESRMRGIENAGSIAVLEGGLKWQEMSLSPQDSQFMESREFQRQEICSVFRVPPSVIGLGDPSYSSAEQANREWVGSCLSTWAARLEQEANRKLLRRDERLRCEISFDALLRADLKERVDIYSTARQFGFMSVNEIRAELGRKGIGEQGDRFLEPTNMIASSNAFGGKNFSDLAPSGDAVSDDPLDNAPRKDTMVSASSRSKRSHQKGNRHAQR